MDAPDGAKSVVGRMQVEGEVIDDSVADGGADSGMPKVCRGARNWPTAETEGNDRGGTWRGALDFIYRTLGRGEPGPTSMMEGQ